MTDIKEIKIGDQVKVKGENDWLTVTDITVQKVKTTHKGELTFIRVYFGVDIHAPVWNYEIESIRDEEEID